MFAGFNWQQMISAFIVLFAVIDIIGSIPIIINLKEKGKDVNAMKATVISFALLIGFFYAGDMMLKLFHVDIESFAVAGAFVIFLMSLEMILDIEIFKNQGPIKEATLVPLVFPLLAGAGAFTTLLSLRAEYAVPAFKALNGRAMFIVAGAPACMDDLKAAGIENFIHVRVNVLETLKEFNAKLLK